MSSPAAQLAQRMAEWRAKATGTAADTGDGAAGPDFKSMVATSEQTDAGTVPTNRAAAELGQALAAPRRPADQTLGICQHCGKPVNLGPFHRPAEVVLCATCQPMAAG